MLTFDPDASVHLPVTIKRPLELDLHANTCCVGKESLVIYDYDRPVTFSGYDPQLGSGDFKIVLAVLEYTHTLTG